MNEIHAWEKKCGTRAASLFRGEGRRGSREIIARRIVISSGVSGGRDSVALLPFSRRRGFRQLCLSSSITGCAGRRAAPIARFVTRSRRIMDWPRDHRKMRRGQARGGEFVNRSKQQPRARYNFFARIAKVEKCSDIFLAHHADDQVETFPLQSLRGAAASGSAAMQAETPERQPMVLPFRILRPLLRGVARGDRRIRSRAQIEISRDREHESASPRASKMRHQIIPAIEKRLGREIPQSIWKRRKSCARTGVFTTIARHDATERLWPELARAARAPQSLLIHQWLQKTGVRNITFDLVQSVRSLLDVPASRAKSESARRPPRPAAREEVCSWND